MTTLYKAQPVGADVVPDVLLKITQTAPRHDDLAEARIFYRAQARHIADVLRRSLPGGTYDELVVCLLQDKASLLVVPLITRGEEKSP